MFKNEPRKAEINLPVFAYFLPHFRNVQVTSKDPCGSALLS